MMIRGVYGFGQAPVHTTTSLPSEQSICPQVEAQYRHAIATAKRTELAILFGGAAVSIGTTLLAHLGYRTTATYLGVSATLVGAIYAGIKLTEE